MSILNRIGDPAHPTVEPIQTADGSAFSLSSDDVVHRDGTVRYVARKEGQAVSGYVVYGGMAYHERTSPYPAGAPDHWLRLLTPTPDARARRWRDACRIRQRRKDRLAQGRFAPGLPYLCPQDFGLSARLRPLIAVFTHLRRREVEVTDGRRIVAATLSRDQALRLVPLDPQQDTTLVTTPQTLVCAGVRDRSALHVLVLAAKATPVVMRFSVHGGMIDWSADPRAVHGVRVQNAHVTRHPADERPRGLAPDLRGHVRQWEQGA